MTSITEIQIPLADEMGLHDAVRTFEGRAYRRCARLRRIPQLIVDIEALLEMEHPREMWGGLQFLLDTHADRPPHPGHPAPVSTQILVQFENGHWVAREVHRGPHKRRAVTLLNPERLDPQPNTKMFDGCLVPYIG